MNEMLVPAMRENGEHRYVPQIESAEDVERWLAEEWTEDRWREPEANWCALCGLRSLLLSLDLEAPSLQELYEMATAENVYRDVDGRIIGAYHAELAAFIAAKFSLEAEAVRALSQADVTAKLAEGYCLLASVSPKIRELDGEPPEQPSGHFVLVYGHYEGDDGSSGVILHNSTGLARTKTQAHVRTPWKRFLECFSGRAILVRPIE